MSSLSTPSSSAITSSDHGALITITAVVGLTWTVLVYIIRLYIRLRLNGPFGLDDLSATFATLLGVIQTALTLVSVRDGLGRQQDLLSAEQVTSIMKVTYATNLLYIVAICGSKCSLFLLIARLSRQTKHLAASYGITFFTIIWGIASLFIIGFQCGSSHPWDTRDNRICPTLFTRWVVVEVLSSVIEFSISALAVALVWNLAMAFKTKAMVVSAFSAQLLVIIPIIFRLRFVHRSTYISEVTFSSTETTIATQVVLHFSIMAATFPCFRQFLQAFDSGLGATTKIGTDSGTGGATHSSYVLQSLASARDDGRGGNKAKARLRPDSTAEIVTEVASAARESGAGEENMSIESTGSDKAIWRTRQWEIHYEARDRRE